jgi:alkanesulfonate monooxygenase SsuD/methylene tetrahydromethanopterin reductase-like flavin-dependent oxidoreductase (luciferase family)
MTPTLFVAEPCDLRRLREAAKLADESSIDVLWVGDHLLYNVPVLDAMVSLGVLASETNNVHIGTNVLQLPLRQPLTVAKAFATLSFLTRGRVVMGVGVGGEYEPEWIGAGVDLRERGKRCDEALLMLDHYWKGSKHDGVFFAAPGVPLQPEPVAKIPIWIGGRSEAAHARAARNDGYIGLMLSVRGFAEARARILDLGGDRDGFAFGLQLMTRIGRSRDEAADVVCKGLGRIYAADPQTFDRYVAAGTPDQVADFVHGYVEQGLNHASFYLHGEDWKQQASRLVDEVLPLLSGGS